MASSLFVLLDDIATVLDDVATMMREGSGKPVCIAESISRRYV